MPHPRKRLTLMLLGDVMLGRAVNETLYNAPPAYPWGNTRPPLHKANWRVANLECVFSDRPLPGGLPPKVFRFRSDSKNLAVLQAAGINAVSLANNHILDYGPAALADTLELLDAAGIGHAGAGRTFAQASALVVHPVGNLRIGLLAFTDNEPTWAATPHRPGVWYIPLDPADPRARQLFSRIMRAKKQEVDFLIVAAHWGSNWGYRPAPELVTFGHALIDAGADVVFGHSCHVCRGVERYRQRPLLYSTGDFIDDYQVDARERNDETFLFELELQDRRWQRLHPVLSADCRARMAAPASARAMAARMQRLCAAWATPACWKAAQRTLEIALPRS